jgi:hypothetical protein
MPRVNDDSGGAAFASRISVARAVGEDLNGAGIQRHPNISHSDERPSNIITSGAEHRESQIYC